MILETRRMSLGGNKKLLLFVVIEINFIYRNYSVLDDSSKCKDVLF